MFFCETLFNDSVSNDYIQIPQYSCPVRCDSQQKRCGGVCLYVKLQFPVKHIQDLPRPPPSIECVCCLSFLKVSFFLSLCFVLMKPLTKFPTATCSFLVTWITYLQTPRTITQSVSSWENSDQRLLYFRQNFNRWEFIPPLSRSYRCSQFR